MCYSNHNPVNIEVVTIVYRANCLCLNMIKEDSDGIESNRLIASCLCAKAINFQTTVADYDNISSMIYMALLKIGGTGSGDLINILYE